MKTLMISVADDVYKQANEKAAAKETSLPEVVQVLLAEWARDGRGGDYVAANTHGRAEWQKFLDELAARPLKSGPSVGPLNREELYRRGVPGH